MTFFDMQLYDLPKYDNGSCTGDDDDLANVRKASSCIPYSQ